MTVRPQIVEIKKLVVRTFIELGVASPLSLSNGGIECSPGWMSRQNTMPPAMKAVWLLKKGLIRFSDAEGNTLRVIRLHPKIVGQVMAA